MMAGTPRIIPPPTADGMNADRALALRKATLRGNSSCGFRLSIDLQT